jgi:hypothetical protein
VPVTTNLLVALIGLFMLVRNGLIAARALRAPAGEGARVRAVVPLLTCLLSLVVLAVAARALVLSASPPGGAP